MEWGYIFILETQRNHCITPLGSLKDFQDHHRAVEDRSPKCEVPRKYLNHYMCERSRRVKTTFQAMPIINLPVQIMLTKLPILPMEWGGYILQSKIGLKYADEHWLILMRVGMPRWIDFIHRGYLINIKQYSFAYFKPVLDWSIYRGDRVYIVASTAKVFTTWHPSKC